MSEQETEMWYDPLDEDRAKGHDVGQVEFCPYCGAKVVYESELPDALYEHDFNDKKTCPNGCWTEGDLVL